jgi:hypothetical protein
MANIYDTAPTVPDLYSRVVVETFDDRNAAPIDTGFLAFFSRGTGVDKYTLDPNAVEINIIRGYEQLAKMVQRGMQSRPLGSVTKPTKDIAFTTIDRTFPLIKELADMDLSQLDKRFPNDPVYTSGNANLRQRRLTELATTYHGEHVKRSIRTMEYLAAQSILTGTMPSLLDTVDTDLIYDFNRSSNMFITAAALWTLTSTNPLIDLDAMWDAIRRNGKAKMDMVLCGQTSAQAFIDNTIIKELAENRRYEMAKVGNMSGNVKMVGDDVNVPQKFAPFIDAGFTCFARIWTPKQREMFLFTYEGIYQDDALAWQNYMPVDLVLGAASDARCDRYFGPDDTMPNNRMREAFYREVFGISKNQIVTRPQNLKGNNTVRPEWFWFDAYSDPTWTAYTCRTQIAPIFAPTQTDAFAVLDGTVP